MVSTLTSVVSGLKIRQKNTFKTNNILSVESRNPPVIELNGKWTGPLPTPLI